MVTVVDGKLVEIVDSRKPVKRDRFLVGLSSLPGRKGFNCPTVLISAENKDQAAFIAQHNNPHKNISGVKKVNY